MFAAASGARLAHRHNKTVKKQISASQIEGLQIQCKRQHPAKCADAYGDRLGVLPHRRPDHATKLYCDPNFKLSSSYVDINGRIAKLGHFDFEAALFLREKQELRKKKLKIRRRRYELPAHVATRDIAPFPQFPPNSWGKAAWQDRELNHELEPRVSICVPNEAAITHRTKQREAHSRWVKRNRIHDLSFGECSSDEEFLYGVQNGAANLLLYVGLGTMCVGMIIAFVGTGEKGFKTMELRLIGPSLIGAGVLIIIFRIMLCVCPSKCLRLKKHKQKLKNSTNKLNSEGPRETGVSREALPGGEEEGGRRGEGRKRVSIAMLPTTSGLAATSSERPRTPQTPKTPDPFVVPMSFLENEKSRDGASGRSSESVEKKMEEKTNLELKQLNGLTNNQSSFFNLPETLVSPETSDVSITSLIDVSPPALGQGEVKRSKELKISKFEASRSPKNSLPMEIVLNPSSLNDTNDTQ